MTAPGEKLTVKDLDRVSGGSGNDIGYYAECDQCGWFGNLCDTLEESKAEADAHRKQCRSCVSITIRSLYK